SRGCPGGTRHRSRCGSASGSSAGASSPTRPPPGATRPTPAPWPSCPAGKRHSLPVRDCLVLLTRNASANAISLSIGPCQFLACSSPPRNNHDPQDIGNRYVGLTCSLLVTLYPAWDSETQDSVGLAASISEASSSSS